jgi:S1-C subfamily serine protease
VRAVAEDSPAARAGIQRGDVIVTAAQAPLAGPDSLYTALDGAAGGSLELRLVRGSQELTVTASLGSPGDPPGVSDPAVPGDSQ